MKEIWKDVWTAACVGLILPGIFLNGAVYLLDSPAGVIEATEPIAEETFQVNAYLPVYLRQTGGFIVELDMDIYLTGVVMAEMPASFEMEALKAQAVAARTYTQKAIVTGGKHGDGSVCTKAECCQAYLTEYDYREQGGTQENIERIQEAVLSTSGQVLSYDGELIEATYFACSGGYTEDALAVWGTSYPYLKARPSPGEEQASGYVNTVNFTPRQFQNALGVILADSPESWFGNKTYTAGGGIDTILIGEQPYTGIQLRRLLGLRSTVFDISVLSENISITTYGYGHRVGMSQYGADAMAVLGSSYEEILDYYYPGTELVKIDSQHKT